MIKKNYCIIFEAGFTGHRSEYISHLMRFIINHPDEHGKFIFVLNEKICGFIEDLCQSPHYLTKFLDLSGKHGNPIKKSLKEWDLISEILKENKSVSEIIFMEVDPYLPLLSLGRFKKFNLSVKGILFQPYIHFKEITPRGLLIYKNLFKNYLFQKLSVSTNKNIKQLFILNDKEGVEIMNGKIKKIFSDLPDPIAEAEINASPEKYKSVLEKFNLNKNKNNLLVFGSIDKRKNLISIIDALRMLPRELKENINLIIAGKLGSDVRESYLYHIRKFKHEINISYNDDFIYGEEREILFQNCDLVIMPYINFYSASSVLGHAIFYNKNIVAPNKGLLARIVKDEKLGINVDPLNLNEIKDAILQLLTNKGKYSYDSIVLMEEYNPINFSKLILRDPIEN